MLRGKSSCGNTKITLSYIWSRMQRIVQVILCSPTWHVNLEEGISLQDASGQSPTTSSIKYLVKFTQNWLQKFHLIELRSLQYLWHFECHPIIHSHKVQWLSNKNGNFYQSELYIIYNIQRYSLFISRNKIYSKKCLHFIVSSSEW